MFPPIIFLGPFPPPSEPNAATTLPGPYLPYAPPDGRVRPGSPGRGSPRERRFGGGTKLVADATHRSFASPARARPVFVSALPGVVLGIPSLPVERAERGNDFDRTLLTRLRTVESVPRRREGGSSPRTGFGEMRARPPPHRVPASPRPGKRISVEMRQSPFFDFSATMTRCQMHSLIATVSATIRFADWTSKSRARARVLSFFETLRLGFGPGLHPNCRHGSFTPSTETLIAHSRMHR